MTIAELDAFLERDFPQVFAKGRIYAVEAVGHGRSTLRCRYSDDHLRPGGTISGPTMMTLADLALYVAILASIGPVALAVTTNLSINFLSRPKPRDLIGDCRLLKLGKRLAVGEVAIRSADEADLVAHVTGTYSIPPGRG